uniref:Uncharacterized protein n=1 Tax=Sphaerodactylus townsendi TaxID=933632 RepID=A0ACB8F6G9_9SAUR
MELNLKHDGWDDLFSFLTTPQCTEKDVTRIIVHQILQVGKSEMASDVNPVVFQAVNTVVFHRIPASMLCMSDRQGIAPCLQQRRESSDMLNFQTPNFCNG